MFCSPGCECELKWLQQFEANEHQRVLMRLDGCWHFAGEIGLAQTRGPGSVRARPVAGIVSSASQPPWRWRRPRQGHSQPGERHLRGWLTRREQGRPRRRCRAVLGLPPWRRRVAVARVAELRRPGQAQPLPGAGRRGCACPHLQQGGCAWGGIK